MGKKCKWFLQTQWFYKHKAKIMYKTIQEIRITAFLVGYSLGTISQSNEISSCHDCNCVEDDEKRAIKAQMEMNRLTRENGWESLLYSTLVSKHKSQFQL